MGVRVHRSQDELGGMIATPDQYGIDKAWVLLKPKPEQEDLSSQTKRNRYDRALARSVRRADHEISSVTDL